MENKDCIVAGIISDTHGLLRPSIAAILEGTDMIIHAGDVGGAEILEALERIAPVFAVQGNMDRGTWAGRLPSEDVVEAGAAQLYVLHDISRLDLEPRAAGFHGVIFGHTHQPFMENRDGVLYMNPGSAGPRRRDYPISTGLLYIKGTKLNFRIIETAS